MNRVTLGLERLLASDRLRGCRVGLLCNAASVDGSLLHAADRLAASPEVTLAALFTPQHGWRADVQDNMIETPHSVHPTRQVPVYSLYSDTREPTRQMLAGLDCLVVDLQDVGTRVYTFASTMANCLRACRAYGLKVIVCDRPNPIGGESVEGPVLRTEYASFVGQFPIPMRHGMTMGELARLFNEEFRLGADLEVIPMAGWRRSMYFDETGLPWVMPSPNMPTLETALVYPGTVLFEGTNVSEGRGTTRPFELIGAPWIDGEALARELNGIGLPGVRFRPVGFRPTFHKHAGQVCGGCQIHVTDRRTFRPVLTAIALLEACVRQDPTRFAWRPPPYEYEKEKLPIDIIAGTDELRLGIERGTPAVALAESWESAVRAFLRTRERFLLY